MMIFLIYIMYSHENASGYYRVSVFFFSQVIIDMIAKRIIPVLLFSTITYYMVGFQSGIDKFSIYLLTLFNVSITSTAIIYAFSAMTRAIAIAGLFSALTFVISMVCLYSFKCNVSIIVPTLSLSLPLSLTPSLFLTLSSCLVDSSFL